MRVSRAALAVVVAAVVVAASAAPAPAPEAAVPDTPDGPVASLEEREHIVQTLEDDISRTALLAAAARAVREQQAFENDILKDTVAALVRDRGDPEQLRRDVRELKELVAQDKAQVEVLSAVLRAPRQVEASASAGAGSDSGSIISLLPTLLGGSSGSGGGDSGGGGSNVLSLVSGVLGASSGGGGGGDGESGGGGGSNVLSLVSGLLGASSGGGESSSSGGGGGGIIGNLFLSKLTPPSTEKPAPGTYNDLIGKGLTGYDPVSVFSNNLGGAITTKFNIFNSLFSVLTSVLGASSGGSSGGGGAFGAAASLSKS